jgi:hypothetical protein
VKRKRKRSHLMSRGTLDAESDGAWIIGWECARCGEWVREFGALDDSECRGKRAA